MKTITLTREWAGNPPGSILTVDEARAAQLEADGYLTSPELPLDKSKRGSK